ncbi:MAG: hypothetical protein KAJ19_14560 [Gammaproteobacteria bacterium]|nr:hypothetical protein [Gammaproteobacteria bacterium]
MKRKPDFRAVGWHVSEFHKLCPREEVLRRIVGKEEKSPTFAPRTKRIFDVGSALHKWYQNDYFGNMGILWGKWMCLGCETIYWGFKPKDDCWCGRTYYDYKEVPVEAKLSVTYSEKKSIVGHSDGLIYWCHKWYVLEIKTINDRGFERLTGAYADHKSQSLISLDLIRNRYVVAPDNVKVPMPIQVIMIYVNKNDSMEKLFLLDQDEETTSAKSVIPDIIEAASSRKILPEKKTGCVTKSRKPACQCKMKDLCFSCDNWDQVESRVGV